MFLKANGLFGIEIKPTINPKTLAKFPISKSLTLS